MRNMPSAQANAYQVLQVCRLQSSQLLLDTLSKAGLAQTQGSLCSPFWYLKIKLYKKSNHLPYTFISRALKKMLINPAVQDINGIGFPKPGFSTIQSVSAPGSTDDMSPARLLSQASKKDIGSIALKSWEQLTYTYICPPLNDGSDLLLMPEQLCFTVNECDIETGTTLVLSLAKLNKLMQEQWDDFVLFTSGGVHGDLDAVDFLEAMRTYGESTLEQYHNARLHCHQDDGKLEKSILAKAATKGIAMSLHDFYIKSTEPGYCYLTRHGILSRISFAGVVVNTNRAVTLQEVDRTEFTDHYSQVNVAYAKRTRVANVFGTAEKIMGGSKLWLELTRKRCRGSGKYGAFVIKPNGDRVRSRAREYDITYISEAGEQRKGFCWPVGRVLEPSTENPQPFSIENANGTGYSISERVAHEVFATIPSMYVALGFGH